MSFIVYLYLENGPTDSEVEFLNSKTELFHFWDLNLYTLDFFLHNRRHTTHMAEW